MQVAEKLWRYAENSGGDFWRDRNFAARRALVLLVLTAAPWPASAHTVAVEQTNVRYDEDWSVLRSAPVDAERQPWWLPLKYVPLDAEGSVYASFGLEARARYEGLANNLWGGAPAPDDGYLWLRLAPHVDLHAGPLRAFVQPILGRARGVAGGPGPVDETGADMLQAFGDAKFALGEGTSVTLRGGRELIALGSERLVGLRYGPNIPQAFDGARVMVDHGAFQAQVLAAKPVSVGQGDFDDRTSRTKRLRGVYTTMAIADGISLDAYWLNYRNALAAFDQGAARENRDSFGARVFGGRGGWAWNWEAVLQRGKFGRSRIRAWTIATETSRQFSQAPLKPKVLLRVNYASGDKDPGDARLNTFNAMFPKGKYFGELSPVGPYNIVNGHIGGEFDFGDGLTLGLAAIPYWRASRRDGIYDVPGNLIRSGQSARARFIGAEAEAALGWNVNSALSLSASYSLFTPGGFIRQTGPARTIHMLGAEAMYRF